MPPAETGSVSVALHDWAVALPSLFDLSEDELNAVAGHQAQLATLVVVEELLTDLQTCSTASEYYEFQCELLRHIYDVEERHGSIRQVYKRLKRGAHLPASAPELGNGREPSEVQSWRLEDLTYVRIGRQLHAVGDALAWQVCGFDRRLISTLSRSSGSGHVYGKEGLPYELGVVTEAYRDRGNFLLLHDLTNCLRIGDGIEILAPGGVLIHEVKKSGRTDPAQRGRMQASVDAIMEGQRLPGDRDARHVQLTTRISHHLAALQDAVNLAGERGTVGLLVPHGHRGVLVADFSRMLIEPERDWIQQWSARRSRLLRQLHLGAGTHEVVSRSFEQAARHTDIAPFGIFPLEPWQRARLTCDFLAYEVHMPTEAVLGAASRAGLEAEIDLSERSGTLEPEAGVFRIRRGDKGITCTATRSIACCWSSSI